MIDMIATSWTQERIKYIRVVFPDAPKARLEEEWADHARYMSMLPDGVVLLEIHRHWKLTDSVRKEFYLAVVEDDYYNSTLIGEDIFRRMQRLINLETDDAPCDN